MLTRSTLPHPSLNVILELYASDKIAYMFLLLRFPEPDSGTRLLESRKAGFQSIESRILSEEGVNLSTIRDLEIRSW